MATSSLPSFQPRLRVFRVLDEDGLSQEFIDKVGGDEKTLPYVDHEKPRDLGWTEEIMANTVGAVLVDEHGDIVAEFEGENAWAVAERARASAKLTFSLDVESEIRAPRTPRVPKGAAVVAITDEDDQDEE